MSEQPRRAQRAEAELRVTPVSVAVPAAPVQEHHLGDRLAAFVDGELDHVARERVQAHLATCPDCLAEAEAERRLKSRLREVLPPAPSTVFMSRLMAIAVPEDDEGQDGGGPSGGVRDISSAGSRGRVRSRFGGSAAGTGFGNGGLRGSSFGNGALGADHPLPGVDPRARREQLRAADAGEERPIAARLRSGAGLGLLPAQPAAAAPAPAAPARGRRLVFAAAGAFSVAAVTLSSALTGVTSTADGPPAGGTGNYAPADGRLAMSDTGAESRIDPALHHSSAALTRPSQAPTIIPVGNLR